MNFPTTFVDEPQDFPVSQLGPVGLESYDKLQNSGYKVVVGLTEELVESLASLAQEPAIKEYCPRDLSERFADRGMAQKWLSKGRAIFLLVKASADKSVEVVGYGWAGGAQDYHVPGGETTFAIRIGEAAKGQGLAAPYSRLIMAGSTILYGAQDVWLEAWRSNEGAVHVYHKLGAVDVASEDSQRLRPNGESVPDTRLYMTLPNELLNP